MYHPLVLEAKHLSLVKWWFDAAFMVHPDCKSHTGAAMTFPRAKVASTSKNRESTPKALHRLS